MAEATTNTRAIDDLGRVVIPGDIRKELGWDTGTRLEVAIHDITVRSIIVREATSRCSLCRRESGELQAVESGFICPRCAAKIK